MLSGLKDFSVADIDVFIRNIQWWKIMVFLLIVVGIGYYENNLFSGIKAKIRYQQDTYTQLRQKAMKKLELIGRLKRYKSNTIFLLSKLQSLNMIRDILKRQNIDYVLDIERQMAVGKSGMINVNDLTATKTKMGIYKYIPLKIIVKNYVDFANLLKTLKLLEKANFILTGVESVTSRNINTIVLVGKLYVK